MSRLGDFFSNTFAQAKSHEPSWIQRLPSMPGSPQSLQDAFIANRWSHPYGSENTSMDIFAGGLGHPLGSQNETDRTIGRSVGSYFLGRGLNNLTGTSWAGSAARGIGGLFGGGGLGGQGGTGGLEGALGGQGGQGYPNYPSIQPINTYQDPLQGSAQFSPTLMAFLSQLQQAQMPSVDASPMISGGGAI